MKLLTNKQKLFLLSRKIEEGGMYYLPPILTFYETLESKSETIYRPTALDGDSFRVKSITNGYCYGNFVLKPYTHDFYMHVDDLSTRPVLVYLALALVCTIPMVVYNLFTVTYAKETELY